MIKQILILILILGISSSCSKKEEEKNTAEIAYIKAMKLLKDKSYSEAAKEFEAIDDEFPFSKWAIKGQVIAIYAHYKNEDLDKVTQGADDFIRLNSASTYVPYVLYMKGLSQYDRIPAITRAQDSSQQASFAFRELIARFPQSDYSQDAKEKLSFVDEHLAGAKMSVGRYQIKDKNYVGAISNFNDVISRNRTTKQVPEAYFRLSEIYKKVGMKNEAKEAEKNLQQQFPENYWTKLVENNE
jgi:outer membrane protein assembly factor BamD